MESEFKDLDQRKAWPILYQEICKTCAKYNYTFKDAKKIENKDYNRYRDVSPYDHSRIKLRRSSIDYINACLVKNTQANRAYILAQGPLGSTSGHFWLMVWEQNCRAVLMLNRVIEKNIVKCHQYWPSGHNKSATEFTYEDVGLKVKFIEKNEATNYTITKLQLYDMETERSREILHFHYTTWPDFGVPQSPASFLNFLLAVRESHVLNSDCGPAVIHCSAGIGRSGTFCLVDSCLVMCEKRKEKLGKGKIKQVLLELRTYRMGLIQTPEQLRFSYLAIMEGAKRFEAVDNENNHMIGQVENGYASVDDDADDVCDPIYGTDNIVKNPPASDAHSLSDRTNHSCVSPATESSAQDTSSPNSVPHTNHTESTLRKRKRAETMEKTKEKLEEMKNKQKKHEMWQKRRRLIFHPFSIGFCVLLGIGTGVFLYKYYF